MLYNIITSVYFVAVLFIITVLLAVYLIKESTKIFILDKIAGQKTRGTSFVYDLLKVRFKSAFIYKNVTLVDGNDDNPNIKPDCDILYISRGGILLITVIPDKGKFDNPKTGMWKYSYENIKHETVTLLRVNPFDSSIPQANVIEDLLTGQGLLNKTITRAVLFTSDEVEFESDYPEILIMGNLFDYIEEFDLSGELNSNELTIAVDTIDTYASINQETDDMVSNISPDQKRFKTKLHAKRDLNLK